MVPAKTKCERWTQTNDGQSDPYVTLCFARAAKTRSWSKSSTLESFDSERLVFVECVCLIHILYVLRFKIHGKGLTFFLQTGGP